MVGEYLNFVALDVVDDFCQSAKKGYQFPDLCFQLYQGLDAFREDRFDLFLEMNKLVATMLWGWYRSGMLTRLIFSSANFTSSPAICACTFPIPVYTSAACW